MSNHGDDIEVPMKPPSKQVRSGDASAATGGASPLFGRHASQTLPESDPNVPRVSMTPSLMTPASSARPVHASDVVITADDQCRPPPSQTQPPSSVVALNSTYSPSEFQSSYIVNIDGTGGSQSAAVQDINSVPVRLSTGNRSQQHPWHYGLCTSCREMNSCLEAHCCLACQTSRQCNLVMNGAREIHWPICLLVACCGTSAYSTNVVQCFVIGQLRQMVRRRYAVSGSTLSDFGYAWCCSPCSVQQMLLEMTVMDDFPGATCYQAVTAAPSIVEMV